MDMTQHLPNSDKKLVPQPKTHKYIFFSNVAFFLVSHELAIGNTKESDSCRGNYFLQLSSQYMNIHVTVCHIRKVLLTVDYVAAHWLLTRHSLQSLGGLQAIVTSV